MQYTGEIQDAPITFKSPVWRHFGFPVEEKDGKILADKTKTVCKHCKKIMPYTAANTSCMQRHLQCYHKNLKLTTPAKRPPNRQATLTNAFAFALPPSSARATTITNDIGVYIAHDMKPFSTVEGSGFRRLLHTLEPRYQIPSRHHFSRTVVPTLYKKAKAEVIIAMKDASNFAITTDCWTSRCTESYITITAHFVNSNWEMQSFVLQTRPLYETHTGVNIADVLKEAVTEWELPRPNHGVAVVTDNARNMDVAIREASFEPHLKCFAHTINLASQAGLKVSRVSRLLGRVRRIVSFFHRSSTAAALLTSKQRQLELPVHKLIMDVVTRWNSSLDMMARYLEQQAAVSATLMSPELRQSCRNLDTLDCSDIALVEDLVRILGPLKTATTVLCEEKCPTLSLIVPLKSMIGKSMTPADDDSPTVAEMKRAILKNISERYRGNIHDYLLESTALDPRFQTLPHLDADQRKDVFQRIQTKAEELRQQITNQISVEEREDIIHEMLVPEDTAPAPKRSALENLLGDSFGEAQQLTSRSTEKEVELYRQETTLPLSCCPLTWWRQNQSKYPSLAAIAKVHLSIPATSVASERVFSTAGGIVTAQRAQLDPENVDMLVFLKKNMTLKD